MQQSVYSRAYKNYLLILLMAILAINYVDRMALGVMLEDIKADLQVSDTQLGLLSGIAFSAFYAVMGIPIARWADRGNRVLIITITTALWSVATALCGVATSFMQMLVIRIGIAVGEAGCIPPAHSLIADTFTRAERPRAVARYMLGGPLSFCLGYLLVGWLNEFFGWRMTFMLIALPGFLAAALVGRTLREPRVASPALAKTADPDQPGFKEVLGTLWKSVAFRHLLLCHSVWYFFGFGLLQWQPAFFIRSHGLTTGEIGTWFSVIYAITGLAVYFGGELAARYAADNERVQLRACAGAFVFFAVVSPIAYLVPSATAAMSVLVLASLGHAVLGPILATVQTLVPPRMRAMSLAIIYLFANLIGLGLGPLAAGVLSDALQPAFGAESLRYALVILCPGHLWAGWHLWRASQTIDHDLGALNVRHTAGISVSNRSVSEAAVAPGFATFEKRGASNANE